jgi:hypothetical protein
MVVQSVLLLGGGALVSYLPASWVRPRDPDSIAWAGVVGLLGSLVFTVVDTIVLRPLGVYHWTWDAIGGGSGFWYIPVWWMAATVLAWLGSWVAATSFTVRDAASVMAMAGQTVMLSVIMFAILTLTQVAPVHPAVMALAFALGLVVHVALAAALRRR